MDWKRKIRIGLPKNANAEADGNGIRTGGKQVRVLLLLLAGALIVVGLPAALLSGRESGKTDAPGKTEESVFTSSSGTGTDIRPVSGDGKGTEEKEGSGNGGSAASEKESSAGDPDALVLLPEPGTDAKAVVDILPRESDSSQPSGGVTADGGTLTDGDGKRTEGTARTKKDADASAHTESGEEPAERDPAEISAVLRPDTENPFGGPGEPDGEEDGERSEADGSGLFGDEKPGEGKHF